MKLNTVAKEIVHVLEIQGIDCVFGMPGYQNLELYDCLADSSIRNVLVTNEACAPFMADGYHYVSGKIAVCLAIPGPGFTNMFTGLAESYVDTFPLVVIVSGVNKEDKSFPMHGVEQLKAVAPLVKATFKLECPAQITKVLNEAILLAQKGEPGPVVLEIPENFFTKETEKETFIPVPEKSNEFDSEKLNAVIEVLQNAKSCGIYIGKGALGAQEEIIALSDILSAPIATTISGRGVVPEDHEFAVGFGFSPAGSLIAKDIFQGCDCLIAIGCKFSEVSTGQWSLPMPEKLIHIDINENVFHKNYQATITVCGDAKEVLSQILNRRDTIQKNKDFDLIKRIAEGKEKYCEFIKLKEKRDAVSPPRFYYELRQQMKRDAILAVDCGYHQLWSYTDYTVLGPGTYLTTSNYQAMGFSIPAAIGAKLARLDKDVVCLCGDGCFLMNGFELVTAKREGVKIICIVFNDKNLGLIKQIQSKGQGRVSSTNLTKFELRNFSDSIGFGYVAIESDRAIAASLMKAFASPNSTIIDVNVNYDEEPTYYKGLSSVVWQRLPDSEKLKRSQKILERKRNGSI